MRFILAIMAVWLCWRMIKHKSSGGLIEWLIIALGCYASLSIILEVIG